MNREQLEEIRARVREATFGTWIAVVGDDVEDPHTALGVYSRSEEFYVFEDADVALKDADFIAAARQDIPALLDEIDLLNSTLHAVLMGVAEDYRQCIAAARATARGEYYYAKVNGRAEAYRQAATRLAEATGLPIPDWDRIRREVPADGVYRATKQVRYWWHHNDCGPTPGGDGTTKLFCIGCGNSTGEWRRGDPIAPDSATPAEGSAEGGTSKGSSGEEKP